MTHSSRNFPFATHGPIDNDVPLIPRDDFWGEFPSSKRPSFRGGFFLMLKSTSIIFDLVCLVEIVDDL